LTPTFFLNSDKHSLIQITVLSGENIREAGESLIFIFTYVQGELKLSRGLGCGLLAFLEINHSQLSFWSVLKDAVLVAEHIVGNEAIDSLF
jgi:hypothetical protein